MVTAKLNVKGQITIPRRIRQTLGFQRGDEFELIVQEQALLLKPKAPHDETAFGVYQATHTVSLAEMEQAIRRRGAHDRD